MTSPSEITARRGAARRRLLAARAARRPEEVAAASAAIVARLEALLPTWLSDARAAIVALYWPLPGEIDLRGLMPWLRARGATLALPICGPRGTALTFGRYDEGAPLVQSPWGLWEPIGAPPVTPTLLLVPAVGFDATGHRLGHGAGYYDRTLAGLPDAVAVAVAWADAELPTIDPQPHDVAVAAVVTERGVVVRR